MAQQLLSRASVSRRAIVTFVGLGAVLTAIHACGGDVDRNQPLGGDATNDGRAGTAGAPDEVSTGPDGCSSSAEPGLYPRTGCHEGRFVPDEYKSDTRSAPCMSSTSSWNVFDPNDLPCGSCGPTNQTCEMNVWAVCECNGTQYVSASYFNVWLCSCVDGSWRCWLKDVSGTQCEFPCAPDAGP